ERPRRDRRGRCHFQGWVAPLDAPGRSIGREGIRAHSPHARSSAVSVATFPRSPVPPFHRSTVPPSMDVHVVTHTHWDREWYHPAEHFRQRLVALVDELLDEPPAAD